MNISEYLPDDALRLVFLELSISSIKSVLCTSWKWNRIVDTDPVWIKIAGRLAIPSKVAKGVLKYYPDWEVYNEENRAKDKIKHFLTKNRTVFLFITNEVLKHGFGKPFSYDTGHCGCNFYPEALWPKSVTIGNSECCTYYPFHPRVDPIFPICVHDKQGQTIKDFPNRVQYFYLLNKNEGDALYWIYQSTFYRVICSQQSIHSNLKEKTFQELVSERVDNLVKSDHITLNSIESKKMRVEEIHKLIDIGGVVYDKRWLLIC